MILGAYPDSFKPLAGAGSEAITDRKNIEKYHSMKAKNKNQRYKPDPTQKQKQAEFYATWFAANAEALAEGSEREAAVKKGRNASYAATFRARQLKAIPPWADLTAIEKVYVEGAKRKMHVDHVYPLQGEKVCGLHVADNLALLSPEDNLRKGNRLND